MNIDKTTRLLYPYANRLFHPRGSQLPTLTMAEAKRIGYPFDGTRNVAPDPKLFGPPANQSGCRCVTCQP
jgi:hypothetical protein